MPRLDGLFAQRGWTAFCSAHKALARSEVSRSFVAPIPLPTSSRVQQRGLSISDRFRQQQMKKKKLRQQVKKKKKDGQTSGTVPNAAGDD